MSAPVEAIAVCKNYPTRSGPLCVLTDCTLTLQPGECVAIVGPSGSGKSTLLNILGTLEPPSTGQVRIGGRDPFTLPEKSLAAFRNRHVGFVFQEHHLLPQCCVLENVLIPTFDMDHSRGRPCHIGDGAEDAEQRARRLLDRVGLAHRLDHLPSELSGGERQRVAVARALINRPTLLLADEPTGNLDRRSAEAVADLLVELQREENAVLVVVTHSMTLAHRFSRRLELSDGRLDAA